MYYFYKLRIWVVGIMQILVIIISFMTFIELNYVVVIQISSFVCALVVLLHEYFFASITFISSMFRLHRFEFKRHGWRMILLSIAILVSIMSSLFCYYFIIVTTSCLIAQKKAQVKNREDLCFNIFAPNLTPSMSARLYFWFKILELLPFILYFILNRPKDYFVCLGKDPERRYSKFQLTREETAVRE